MRGISCDHPTFVPCDSEHAIDDVHVNIGVHEGRRTHSHRVKCRDVIYFDDYKTREEFRRSCARNKNERNTIGEPPITLIAGRVTTPTGDSLTTHSLFTDTIAAAATYLFIYIYIYICTRKRRKRALPTSRNSLNCFSIQPRPGRRCFLSIAGP